MYNCCGEGEGKLPKKSTGVGGLPPPPLDTGSAWPSPPVRDVPPRPTPTLSDAEEGPDPPQVSLPRRTLRCAPPPGRTQSPPLPSPRRAIGREPAWAGGGGEWMCLCVTGEGGEKGGESPGARERERAASEEGGREAGPPTWGALLARSSLAGAASHLGRRTSADTLAAAALGEARTAPGGCAQRRQLPPGCGARAPAPAGARRAQRSRSPARRSRSPARVTARRTRRRPELTMVAARAESSRVAGRPSRSAG